MPTKKMFKNISTELFMVPHTFNLSTGEAEAGDFEASLLYLTSSRTTLAIAVSFC